MKNRKAREIKSDGDSEKKLEKKPRTHGEKRQAMKSQTRKILLVYIY